MMMKDVAAVLRDRMGNEARRVPTRGLPDFMLQFSSLFDPTIRMVTGELGKQRITPSDHARDILGWVPRPAADTIVDTARSLIDKGVIKV
jgi:dihydroflavonol-4-reductase